MSGTTGTRVGLEQQVQGLVGLEQQVQGLVGPVVKALKLVVDSIRGLGCHVLPAFLLFPLTVFSFMCSSQGSRDS